jgi:hypothetical protein
MENFEIFKIKKGTSLYYVGVDIVNEIYEFPSGTRFYSFDQKYEIPIYNASITNRTIEDLLSDVLISDTSIFTDINTALKNNKKICSNSKCITAYTVKKTCNFIVLDKKLIETPFKKLCEKYIKNDDTYAGFVFYNDYGGFETVFCNHYKWLERNYSDEDDWQYNIDFQTLDQNDLKKQFMDQMDLYETTNSDWHRGNLLKHSVWAELWSEHVMEKMMPLLETNHKISFSQELKKLIAFTAFVHDIGKMGINNNESKFNQQRQKVIYRVIEDHPKYGAHYLVDTVPFINLCSSTIKITDIPVDNLLIAFGIDIKYKKIIAKSLLLHTNFGYKIADLNRNPNFKEELSLAFINEVYKEIKNDNYIQTNLYYFYVILVIISIADILSTEPFGIGRYGSDSKTNAVSKIFPFIHNLSKQFRGGMVIKITPEYENYIIDFGMYILNSVKEKLNPPSQRATMSMNYNPKRKTSKRKTSKRKTSKRKTSKRKI